jgi:ABC-type multidrug transport system ATPase subunit
MDTRDAELLKLNEPTAALDPRAEAAPFARFAELSRGRATPPITHRLRSVRLADRILVLKEGRLVDEGGHQGQPLLGGPCHDPADELLAPERPKLGPPRRTGRVRHVVLVG